MTQYTLFDAIDHDAYARAEGAGPMMPVGPSVPLATPTDTSVPAEDRPVWHPGRYQHRCCCKACVWRERFGRRHECGNIYSPRMYQAADNDGGCDHGMDDEAFLRWQVERERFHCDRHGRVFDLEQAMDDARWQLQRRAK